MREMHKWKDKVEFSLDNRQIFFLFFGLSVLGCFVFALGVMVGRRVEFRPTGEVAALSDDSLGLLRDEPAGEPKLSFKEGLQHSGTEGFPKTRDPDSIKTDEDEDDEDQDRSDDQADDPKSAPEGGHAKPEADSKRSSTGQDKTLAASNKPASNPKGAAKIKKSSVDPSKRGQSFTLQMKAFARAEDAEAFADRLRRKGHEVRVEASEVRGRLWHRVRLGSFSTWDEAVQAKNDFEGSEQIIAYVVRE